MKNLKLNKKGFTLIELMIVIAIIGVLAAIAIPNYISYRNKAYCSAVESNVHNLATAVAEYYSIPSRTAAVPDLRTDLDWDNTLITTFTLNAVSIPNTVTGNTNIRVTGVDVGHRCPNNYMTAAGSGWTPATWTYTLDL